jgi:hypothetical protein
MRPVGASVPIAGLFDGNTTGSPGAHAPSPHRVPAAHAVGVE